MKSKIEEKAEAYHDTWANRDNFCPNKAFQAGARALLAEIERGEIVEECVNDFPTGRKLVPLDNIKALFEAGEGEKC